MASPSKKTVSKAAAKKAPAAKKAVAKPAGKARPAEGKAAPAKAAKKPVVALKKPAAAVKKPAAPVKKAVKVAKPVKKAVVPKPAVKPQSRSHVVADTREILALGQPVNRHRTDLSPWLKKQQARLLALKDSLLDAMSGVAKDNLRSRAEGNEASAHGMHQADAGSDAYDRDFALNLLSQEQDALFEIDEALKRIEKGTYGICEMSGKPIPKARLEARPFARFTVECQTEMERKNRFRRLRQPVARLFDSVDEESAESDEEETTTETKD